MCASLARLCSGGSTVRTVRVVVVMVLSPVCQQVKQGVKLKKWQNKFKRVLSEDS